MFIDDSIANCKKINELGIETILFSSKGNINDETDLYRVDSWKDIYEKVKEKRSLDILLSDDRDILKYAGKISHEIAEEKALAEFEKYRVIQDKLYQSDFDKLIESSNK